MSDLRVAVQGNQPSVLADTRASDQQTGAAPARSALMDAAAQALAALMQPGQPGVQPDATGAAAISPALGVMLAADFYRRYPGEDVTFYARVQILQPVTGFILRVSLPVGVRLGGTSDAPGGQSPDLTIARERVNSSTGDREIERRTLIWYVEKAPPVGAVYDFEARVTTPPLKELHPDDSPIWPGAETWLVCNARAEPFTPTLIQPAQVAHATVAVAVFPKSRYLQYLPALYERDEFMGRFLMLFESFWAPIEMQIAGMADYFDPRLAPLEMTRWLAERFNLALESDLPEKSQRNLLKSAVHLYRNRGTRRGLQELLEIHTNGPVEIVERRAENFRIGGEARLGHGVALGSANQPHTFVVRLRLPPLPHTSDGKPVKPEEMERREKARRDRLRAIIDAEKPAHVTYSLDIEVMK